ncbi:MAG: VOC family protein [Gemmatimonadota bacterium]
MPTKTLRGTFVWHELMTTDPKAAQRFYTKLIGWGTQPFEHNPSYVMWMNGETPVGGVMALPDEAKEIGAPPSWISYVAVPDVDETARRAAKLGGKALRAPEDIPEVGRFAAIADPQGAVLCAFRGLPEMEGHGGPPGIGEFTWHELATTDPEGAFRYYSELFGWEKSDAMDMGDAGVYQIYALEGTQLGGIYRKPAGMPGPPDWLYYINIRDVKPAVEQVKKLGGRVLHGPAEVPGGWIVQCLDPQGAAFALYNAAE